ncbi:response regulator [Marinoscillum sp. MHG1-6]|uniref:response regulator n=1 Tax=Marinoscillum sp. MHG1-6 TaxID=2959627 RepID=UPI0021583AF7|nr:response regulator [Marinoscillum sp. MHG1-6]
MDNLEAKILLAEDRMEDAHLTHFALEEAGFVAMLHWVKNGEEALEYLKCEGVYKERSPIKPKMILMDLKMPKLDGIETLKIIKSDKRYLSIPVIMLTTSREEVDRIRAIENHANSYIVKPVDSEKFSQTVKALGEYWMERNFGVEG